MPPPSLGASFYIALIAVLGLAGAGLARGLCQPWGARFGRRRLRAVARLGAGMLLLGVAIGVGRWITAGGIGDDGVPGVIITGYFLLGGGLFAALSRASKRQVTNTWTLTPAAGGEHSGARRQSAYRCL